VIVTLAAWLYIIQALLSAGSLFLGPFGFGGGMSSLPTLAIAAIFGAMGYGLLKRESWGRWLALGVSLLSWVCGGLFLLVAIVGGAATGKLGAFFGLLFSGTGYAVFAWMLLFVVLITVVSVVISFKLFFHLCSRDGCEEFGVPYGSAGTVVASVGAWIAIIVGQVLMSSGGMLPLLASQALARNEHSQRDPRQEQRETERREYQRRYEEQQRHAEQEAHLRAIRDAEAQQAPAAVADVEPPQTTAVYQPPPVEEARAPTMAAAQDAEEKPNANRIMKCRDSAGAVMFTQGYCPPGTQRVEMPKSE
jgi:hypothetical protein